jgi:hypothetical protein
MMGRQINFYLMKEDILEVDEYIRKNGMIIIPNYTNTASIEPLKSLLDKNSTPGKFISLPSVADQIKKRYIDTQKYFTIDILDSPVIEFSQPGYYNNTIKMKGRVYYTKATIGNGNAPKNELFLKMADDFFKWIRKNFKNVKLKGYEGLLVTERTNAWLNASEDRELSIDNIFPDAIKKTNYKQLVA